MAIVNFSVPDDVKATFDRTFAGENKSAVVAALMRRAVEERWRQKRRSRAIDALLRVRWRARPATQRQVRRVRAVIRP